MQTVFHVFKDYGGTGYYTILFLAALIYLGFKEEDKRIRILFIYIPAVLQVLFFIPWFYAIYNGLDEGTYYRILWLIPMSVVIAYSACRLISRHSRLGLVLTVLLLMISGTYVYKNIYMTKAENLYHLPQETIDICDMIKPGEDEERIWAAFPAEQVHYVRQYTTTIQMPFGRDSLVEGWDYVPNIMYELYKEPTISVAGLSKHSEEYHINYFIFLKSKPLDENPLDYDMDLIGETENYLVYRNNKVPLP